MSWVVLAWTISTKATPRPPRRSRGWSIAPRGQTLSWRHAFSARRRQRTTSVFGCSDDRDHLALVRQIRISVIIASPRGEVVFAREALIDTATLAIIGEWRVVPHPAALVRRGTMANAAPPTHLEISAPPGIAIEAAAIFT